MRIFRSILGKLQATMILVSIIPMLVVAILLLVEASTQLEQGILQQERVIVREEQKLIEKVLNNYKIQVLQIRDLPPIQGIIRASETQFDTEGSSTSEQWKKRLQTILSESLEKDPDLHAARYIDIHGKEIVSVRRLANGTPYVISDNDLQSKKERAYFTKTMQLGLDDVYVSDAELNKEYGKIEIPYFPVMRFATPVFDERTGEIFGMVIINIHINHVFEQFAKSMSNAFVEPYIIDNYGSFLWNNDKEYMFGRDLGTGKNLEAVMPNVAIAIQAGKDELKPSDEHQYYHIWTKLYFDQNDTSRYWVLMNMIPREILLAPINQLKNVILGIALISVLFCLGISVLLARSIATPLKHLTTNTKNIAEGRMNVDVEYIDRPDEIGILARSFNGMKLKLSEHRHELKERVEIRTQELNALLEKEKKSQAAMLNIMEDLEVLRQSSEATKEQFRTMVKNIPGVVYRCRSDKAWTMEYISDAIEALSGYKAAEFTNNTIRTYASIIHPDDVASVETAVLQGIQSDTPYEVEYRIIRNDGSVRWVYERGKGAFNAAGNVTHLDGVIVDITERKLAEKEAHKFQMAVDSSTDAIVITKPDTTIAYVNEAWVKLNGYPREKAVGRKTNTLKSGETSEEVYDELRACLSAGKAFHSDELINRRSDGSTYNAELTIYPIIENNEVQFYVGIQHDVTQKKRESRAKSEFVSLASHQLRTPLTAIRWILSRLEKGKSGDLNVQQKELVGDAMESCIHMNETIDTMLMLSLLESGKMHLKMEDINMREVFDKVAKLNEINVKAKKQQVVIDCEKTLRLNSDERLLMEIIGNLVSNASKYTPDGGTITLQARSIDHKILIEVQDNGYGIPLHQQDKVFSKFFRADNIVSKDTEGTGLGLYLVQSLTHALGGTIIFTSAENTGTTFTVHLPISPVSDEQENSDR